MRVLVTGASGLLGAHALAFFSGRHEETLGVDRNPAWGDRPAQLEQGDLTDPAFAQGVVRCFEPDILIHCAAMADVDGCERDPARADLYNTRMTRHLARSVSLHCQFVYISTDGLFKGDSSFTTEETPPSPRTVYGRSKLAGEREVQMATENHLILRTNFYGWSSGRKKTAGEWLYQALKEAAPITLFDDFYFTPIYVADFIERLEVLLETRVKGIFHLCGRDRVSKLEFGTRVAERAGFPQSGIRRGSIRTAGLLADRPSDMSLDSGLFRRVTGLELPGCDEGIDRFLKDRETPLSQRFLPRSAVGKALE